MRILRRFLSVDDVSRLLRTCRLLERSGAFYRTDRGYAFASALNARVLAPLRDRARLVLPQGVRYDSFFLRYETGVRAAAHVDPPGRIARLIALVREPDAGGDLVIAGQLADLHEGDAVVFEPSKEEHEVTQVTGERIVWSVGSMRHSKRERSIELRNDQGASS